MLTHSLRPLTLLARTALLALLCGLAVNVFAQGAWELDPEVIHPSERQHHTMVQVGQKLYVYGGTNNTTTFGDLWVYDPQAPAGQRWAQLNPGGTLPPARHSHSAVATSGDTLYIFFGRDGSGNVLNDIWRYTVSTNTWTQRSQSGQIPTARFDHTTALYTGSRVLLFGGYQTGFSFANDKIYSYATTTGVWQELADHPNFDGLADHICTTYIDPIHNEYHYLFFFGQTPSGFNNQLWEYNGQQNTWQQLNPTGTPPPARTKHCVAINPNTGVVNLFGGLDMNGQPLQDNWEYDPATGAWTRKADAPVSFYDSAASFYGGLVGFTGARPELQSRLEQQATDAVLVFGGVSGGKVTNQTLIYRPTQTPAPNPDSDGDGITDATEDAGPHNGDANNDAIPDRLQAHIVSLPNAVDGRYVTLVGPLGTNFTQVSALLAPAPNPPPGVQYPAGFFRFTLNGLAPGAATQVQMLLPTGVTATRYDKYGPEPGNLAPHWYQFNFVGNTGAQFNGNIVTLNFVDGQRGDDDLTANGSIVEPGGPGFGAGATLAVSAQKAGSLLVFPYYTSQSATKANTRLQLSNVGGQTTIVHLFLLDGSNCQQSDFFVCLTPNASLAFFASDYDPEVTGWALAVAVNAQGLPIANNGLIGNAFVHDGNYMDNYGAEAFWATANTPLNADGVTADVRFGERYAAAPSQLAVEIQSPLDVVGQRVVTVGLSGDLTTGQLTGAAQIGTGQAINEQEVFGSFTVWLTGNCQAQATISTTSPRVPNGLGHLIRSGQAGLLKWTVGGAVGLLLTPRTAAWKGIRALHKTAATATTLTIPALAPVC